MTKKRNRSCRKTSKRVFARQLSPSSEVHAARTRAANHADTWDAFFDGIDAIRCSLQQQLDESTGESVQVIVERSVLGHRVRQLAEACYCGEPQTWEANGEIHCSRCRKALRRFEVLDLNCDHIRICGQRRSCKCGYTPTFDLLPLDITIPDAIAAVHESRGAPRGTLCVVIEGLGHFERRKATPTQRLWGGHDMGKKSREIGGPI